MDAIGHGITGTEGIDSVSAVPASCCYESWYAFRTDASYCLRCVLYAHLLTSLKGRMFTQLPVLLFEQVPPNWVYRVQCL